MIFVLTMLFVYGRKNENHWSLLIIRYSLLITHYSEYKHPTLWTHCFLLMFCYVSSNRYTVNEKVRNAFVKKFKWRKS